MPGMPPGSGAPTPRHLGRIVVPGVLALFSILCAPTNGSAQQAIGTASDPSAVGAVTSDHRSPRNRVYVGMWTTHFKEPKLSLRNNWLVGFSREPFFVGTFLNSFDDRAFAGGLQHTLLRRGDAIEFSFGGRLGIVTGYDGRFMDIARESPVLPMIQAFAIVDLGHVGVEVSYTYVVASVAMSYRF